MYILSRRRQGDLASITPRVGGTHGKVIEMSDGASTRRRSIPTALLKTCAAHRSLELPGLRRRTGVKLPWRVLLVDWRAVLVNRSRPSDRVSLTKGDLLSCIRRHNDRR